MCTNYYLNVVAGNVFNTKTDVALPKKYYVGLSTKTPGVDGAGIQEPTGGNYKRVELTNMSAPANGVCTNQQIIDFEESTQNWGTVTHYLIYDSVSGGQLLMYGPLEKSRVVESETIMTLKAGAVKLSVVNIPEA